MQNAAYVSHQFDSANLVETNKNEVNGSSIDLITPMALPNWKANYPQIITTLLILVSRGIGITVIFK
ncbi:hypothetical protein PAEVO_43380 [Paenibacillus sp. GM2FR]|nr:hypothetical protein PAEVO_43380 [Paenibacillus sp. GM2FR]